ncbi:MAG: glycosyltransferase family 4 protein [Chloroflexi bacterium]|nr:glycosyltransferase family 4 protein [Chloroflexota bacterium]
MKPSLLMLSGDRDVAAGRRGPFYYTLEGLSREFDRIDVLTPNVRQAQPRTVHRGVHVHPSPGRRLWHVRWLVRRARALAAERRYHLIVSHDYGIFSNGIAAARLSGRIGAPYVSEIHHVPAHPRRAQWWESAAKLGYRAYLRFAAARARAIRVVNRQEVPELLRRWGVPAEKILVLPSAHVDREVFRPGDHSRPYALGFVGRLVANKGLDHLVEIFATVAADAPNSRFLVVGDGPEANAVQRRLSAAGIEDRVDRIAWVDGPDDLAALYRQMEALACTSRSEGGPRVCLEAMACGTPVFSTPVGLMPEIIEQGVNGWLLPWNAKAGGDLVSQVRRARGALAGAGAAARRATEPFTRERILSAYARAYRDLAAESLP